MTTTQLFARTVFITVLCVTTTYAQSSVRITNNPPAHTEIKPSDLPEPKLENEVNNSPKVIPQPADATLNVPPGFQVTTYAEGGFRLPRWLALAPNGDVFVSDSVSGRIFVLRDKDKDGVAEERSLFLENQKQPFGIAFWKNYIYIGNTDAVVRYNYK